MPHCRNENKYTLKTKMLHLFRNLVYVRCKMVEYFYNRWKNSSVLELNSQEKDKAKNQCSTKLGKCFDASFALFTRPKTGAIEKGKTLSI